MCGIFCCVANINSWQLKETQLDNLLARRGPDKAGNCNCGKVNLLGYVLWQQGRRICAQPYQYNEVQLIFNGDIFNIEELKSAQISDTEWLAREIANCMHDVEILKLFRTLQGPYSIIFYKADTDSLYFSRDCLGRNSLLVEKDEFNFKILSVSYNNDAKPERHTAELPPLGLFKIQKVNEIEPLEWTLFPWCKNRIQEPENVKQLQNIENIFNVHINISSSSIDCAWLSKSNSNKYYYDFYKMFADNNKLDTKQIFEQLFNSQEFNKAIDEFAGLLENSVRQRVQCTTKYCNICLKNIADIEKIEQNKICHHSKIAILFSGGIDCTILALLADKYVDEADPIELINVAFAPHAQKQNTENSAWNVPDRLSAESSLAQLSRLCPQRVWNFVEVNIARSQLTNKLETHIKHLIYPLTTVLDESIGCAFWFAAHGKGTCNEATYESSARVVLLGSGADELFGGYKRHRNAYTRCVGGPAEKLQSVERELKYDWQRIPTRNLARDDRVIADNRKTARAPFIEENVVEFVQNLKSQQRCCYLLEEGLGDKLFLRAYGYRLGLKEACILKKRAIQFGSRIANSKQNANDESVYLKCAAASNISA